MPITLDYAQKLSDEVSTKEKELNAAIRNAADHGFEVRVDVSSTQKLQCEFEVPSVKVKALIPMSRLQ